MLLTSMESADSSVFVKCNAYIEYKVPIHKSLLNLINKKQLMYKW